MIPVQIIATEKQMDLIADMTMKHYDQLAVMYFKMSDTAIIKERKDGLQVRAQHAGSVSA